MRAENAILDEAGEGQKIEEVGKVLPNVGVSVLAQALIVEAVTKDQ